MKPQFKPEEIYLDLSKLSEEQQERVMCVTGTTIEWIKYAGYLIYHKGWKTSNKSWLKDQNLTELTYSQFLDMMGESEEVLQVDIYSGELNTERISTYKKLSEQYNIEESTVRDIFNAGADWVINFKSNQ